MTTEVQVPGTGPVVLRDSVIVPEKGGSLARRCYAACRVVMHDSYAGSAHSLAEPGRPEEIAEAIDWEATLGLRRRVDAFGMGIAEAMDTAQRFELGWPGARELLKRTGELGLRNGFVGAASSDQRATISGLDDLGDALLEQIEVIRGYGGLPIVLPQPWLTQNGATEDDYVRLYSRVIDEAAGPLLLHWLGEAFHPAMRGYFPGASARRILEYRPDVVRGIKISLLDREFEEDLRAELAQRGQVVFTGDDYNFSALIEGSSQASAPLAPLDGRPLAGGAFSHALLGIFDAIVRPASFALQRLAAEDRAGYRSLMEPCEALSRVIFEPPVQHYKAGLAFLSWLNGLQSNPMLANHEERARDRDHYVRVARLASEAGVIENAELAAERLGRFLDGAR